MSRARDPNNNAKAGVVCPSEADEGDNSYSPHTKRTCSIETPEAFRPKTILASSTPHCSRSLNFDDLSMDMEDDRSIRIVDVPQPFMELSLKKQLEKVRLKNNICADIDISIVRFYNYKREDKSVVVEFLTSEIAQKMVELKKVHFMQHTIMLERIERVIYELPTFIEDTSDSDDICAESPKTPVDSNRLLSVEENLSHMSVEDCDLVQNDCDTLAETIDSNYHPLSVEPESSSSIGQSCEMKELPHQVLPSKKVPMAVDLKCTKVLITGFSDPFSEDVFTNFFKKSLMKFGLLTNASHVQFEPYNGDDRSIVVKFESSETVDQLCEMGEFQYLFDVLKFARIEDYVDLDVPSKVEIIGLSEPFAEDVFINFFKKNLMKKGILTDASQVQFEPYRRDTGTLVVEFHSFELAQSVCNLGGIQYLFDELVFLMVANEDGMMEKKASSSKPACLKSNVPALGPLGCVLPFSEEAENDKILLDSKDGLKIFYQVLLELRHTFRGRNHSSSYARLLADLASKNVETNIPELMKKRKTLQDGFNKATRHATFRYEVKGQDMYPYCRVVFGGEPVEVLAKTDFEGFTDPVEVVKQAAVFTKGAVFTTPATKLLISIVAQNLDTYENFAFRSKFWKNACELLVEKGHWYDAVQCEKHFNGLIKKFKDVDETRGKTGASADDCALAWQFYDSMLPILKNNVTANPKIVFSSGTTSKFVLHEEEDEDDPGERHVQTAKARGGPLRKPKSRVDERTDALRAIAKAMADKNEILRKASTSHLRPLK